MPHANEAEPAVNKFAGESCIAPPGQEGWPKAGVVVQENIVELEPPPRPLPSLASAPPGLEGRTRISVLYERYSLRATST